MSLGTEMRDPRKWVADKYQPDFKPQSQDPNKTGIESQMDPQPDYGLNTYKGLGRLEGRIAVVTGADSGIGRAVALAYAREGADVAVCYYSSDDDAKVTQQAVEGAGKKCLLLKYDIQEDSQCKQLIDEAVKTFGRIDILVNNAAFQGGSVDEFVDIEYERVLRTFKTNIISMFSLCKYAIPHIKPGGSIINTGSIQGYQPSPGILDYAATKGAIVDFTKGLAQSLIEKGIRVNCVAPGPVWTPIIVSSFKPEKAKEFGKSYPMKRPAQPVELAPAYVFLASNEASYVCGEILAVTGGKPTM